MYIQSYFFQMVFLSMKLDNNNHSVFRLDYCLVMCTQDCCRVMDEDISDRLKLAFKGAYQPDEGTLVKIGQFLSRPEYKFESERKTRGWFYWIKETM